MSARGSFLAALALVAVIAACASNDTSEDPLHADAGKPGLTCPTVCTGTQKCCKVGQKNFCIETTQDPMNCGDCNAACDRHKATTCAAGKCKCGAAPACDGTKSCCPQAGGAAACLDLTSDNANCGTCGHMCPAGPICQNGGCVCAAGHAPCTGGQTCCGAGCADTNTDDNNCGSCDNKCGDAHCMTGQCMCHIAIVPGLIYTDDTCADFSSGNPFAGPDCCGESCVDRQTSAANCGACGNQCQPMLFSFPACVSGTCI